MFEVFCLLIGVILCGASEEINIQLRYNDIIDNKDVQLGSQRSLTDISSTSNFNYSLSHWYDDPKGFDRDEFGGAVAVRNNIALVASPLHSDFPLYEVSDGKVFVFIDSTGNNNWKVIREIYGEDASEFFGSCVALHSSNGKYFAVVGAPRNNRYGQFSGGAYYFDIELDENKEQAYPKHIVQKERHGGASFGSSVAIGQLDGRIKVAIGATGHRGHGAVFLYTRAKDGSLADELILYGSVSKTGGLFGYSIAFNEDIIAVGAPVLKNGMVFLYKSTTSGTIEEVKYMSTPAAMADIGNDDNDDTITVVRELYYGGSLAVGNGYLFVGCPMNDLRGKNSGSVYVYDLADVYDPSFIQTIFPAVSISTGLEFGWSLSYDTVYKKLFVGSCNRESTSASGGKAFVYVQKGQGYFVEAALHANSFSSGRTVAENRDSLFGKAVSIHGDYAVVGAPFGRGEHYSSGDVYFFKAQSRAEFFSSAGSSASSPTTFLGSISTQVLIGMVLLVMIASVHFYKRNKNEDEDGLVEIISSSCVSDDGDVQLDEDSAHSSHPMIIRKSIKEKNRKDKKSKIMSAKKKNSSNKSIRAYSSDNDNL